MKIVFYEIKKVGKISNQLQNFYNKTLQNIVLLLKANNRQTLR
jgi:hypothetical protein